MPKRQNSKTLTIAVIALAILFVIPTGIGLLVDYWWFGEIDATILFTRTLSTRVLLFAGTALVAWAVVHLNLVFAQRGIVPDGSRLRFQTGAGETAVDLTAGLPRVTRAVAIAVALFFGLGASALWEVALQALNATSFGTIDPIFGRDVGFYVFTLPALSALLGIIAALLVVLLIVLGGVYSLRGDIAILPQRLRLEPTAGMHLSVLLALLFVVWAIQLWFIDSSYLLFSDTGPLVGASYTDLNAKLPALRVSAFAALLAAALVLVGGYRKKAGFNAAMAIAGYMVVSLVGRGIIPTAMQKLIVAPTELTREEPYLAHHITATRKAWGLDSVEVRDLGGEAVLTLDDIRANGPTIENVRLWDRDPLLRTFGQLQEIRTYYDFVQIDDDRYWIDGKYREVLLAPRELNSSSLPTRTFINEHLTFTHGMGLTVTPVNQVTTEGLPVLFVKDLPPSATGSLRVTRPQIYYGELTNNFVITNTVQREFDYPAGDENIYRAYSGTGGVAIGSQLRRLVFAAHLSSSKILLSGDITAESKILYHRNIRERVFKAFPFLRMDRDPYMVIAEDGTLKWMQDAYTTSSRYPYSYRDGDGVSYIRNSVKIVIDAYNGDLVPYVSDPGDPIIQTWERIFPGVFVPMNQMPEDLRAHIRYPEDLFVAQTRRYITYHMNTPATFYNREDEWQIPSVQRYDQSVPFMRHIIMRLPDEDEAEFIFMAPFTPRGKDNLAAWMVARSDGDHYGKLRVYRFPRQSLVFGPRQIENRINQDTEIARQVSLWDQRGSQVIRGDLLVIPIEEGLLYVQPMYLQADGGMIPELKRVVVAYQNQVIMRETLDAALSDMFGGIVDARSAVAVDVSGAPVDAAAVTGAAAATGALGGARGDMSADMQAIIAEAQQRYQAALEAQRQGDWARYGEEIKQLGALLQRLNASQRN